MVSQFERDPRISFMEALRAAIQDQPNGRLDIAALEIASIEMPDLDPEPFLRVLDRIASDVAARLPASADGREFVRVANDHLFGDLGFRGNEIDYNDPRNSCLNYVLDRRTGLPISLSVIYIEVARRLGQPVSGVGLPGHFIVEYNDGEFATYIDPFHSGKLLTQEDCQQLARERTGTDADATALAPVGARYILVRILNNLRSAYFRSKQFDKMVAVTDLLIEAFPRNADYYKARGVARLRMRQFRSAQKDLELYLHYAPEAEDRPQITQQLASIHRWLARLN
jgi:regulator of sirC expression with transglutaminase-like and TPR domain